MRVAGAVVGAPPAVASRGVTAAAIQDHWMRSLNTKGPSQEVRTTVTKRATASQELGRPQANLTLAQHIGLVEAPPLKLTDRRSFAVRSFGADSFSVYALRHTPRSA